MLLFSFELLKSKYLVFEELSNFLSSSKSALVRAHKQISLGCMIPAVKNPFSFSIMNLSSASGVAKTS